ncbi:MAG: GC-type dockerin domain-anchored protein [Phycisphaerales bacterium]
MPHINRPHTAIAFLFAAAGAANAQVVINEVYENPPGSGSTNDALIEYIELYGQPGMDLTGYLIGQFKGGEDSDGDNIPNEPAEIDEAFSLDGLSLGSNGYLVLYNGTPAQSLLPLFLPGKGENSASFFDTHAPSPFDSNGNLNNDGSSTYLLIRRRPFHSVANGASVYAPGYSIWKDVDPDVDYDGKLDFGFEIPGPSTPDSVGVVDPLQIIDELAWSNAGGKEYVRSSEQELSETPDFNPDAASRVAYYGENPMLGLRVNSDGDTVPTRTADEEFIYGDMIGASIDFTYDPSRSGAPTDQSGDGFQDIAISNGADLYSMTPGTFNDHAPTGITQFRFVTGDLNFDGAADAADLALLDADLLGADFDATEDFIDNDTGLPVADPMNPGSKLQSYVFQGRLANGFLAARNLDLDDGIAGANSETVTNDDRAALLALVGPVPCSVADTASPFGTLNFFDISTYIGLYNAGDPAADLAAPIGTLNFFDISTYISLYNAGCP